MEIQRERTNENLILNRSNYSFNTQLNKKKTLINIFKHRNK